MTTMTTMTTMRTMRAMKAMKAMQLLQNPKAMNLRIFSQLLLDQLVTDEWQSMGLPRVLAESAAIASHVLRPLCVDPQEQAAGQIVIL